MNRALSTTQFLAALGCLALIFGAAHDSQMRFGLLVPLVLLCALFAWQRLYRTDGEAEATAQIEPPARP